MGGGGQKGWGNGDICNTINNKNKGKFFSKKMRELYCEVGRFGNRWSYFIESYWLCLETHIQMYTDADLCTHKYNRGT